MTTKLCIECGTPTTLGTRCGPCGREKQRTRNAGRDHYDGPWQTMSKEAIARQPWCSDCGATDDLCTDHVHPRDPSLLDVLCRSCNSKKSAKER